VLTCRRRRIDFHRSARTPRHHDLDYEHNLNDVDQLNDDNDTADPFDTADPNDNRPGTA